MPWLLTLLLPLAALAVPEDFFRDLDDFKALAPAVRASAARVQATTWRARAAALHWSPDLSFGVGKSQLRRQAADVTGTDLSFVNDTDYARLASNWALFRGGADVKNGEAARLLREAEQALYRNENLNVELNGARLIFGSIYLREAREAQAELLGLREEALRIGRARYRQGKIPLEEVNKIEVDLAEQRNLLRDAELAVEENLTGIRGLFVEEPRTRDWPFAPGQALHLEGERSPFLEGLLGRAGAASRRYSAARGAHWPSVDLALQFQVFPLRNFQNKEWSGTLSLSLPLWSRYDISARVAEAGAEATVAQTLVDQRARDEALRREFLKKRIAVAAENAEEARRNVERSQGLYGRMLRSFQVGRLSANDLQLEQNRRIRTLLNLAASRRAYHESLVEACVLWGEDARHCFR